MSALGAAPEWQEIVVICEKPPIWCRPSCCQQVTREPMSGAGER